MSKWKVALNDAVKQELLDQGTNGDFEIASITSNSIDQDSGSGKTPFAKDNETYNKKPTSKNGAIEIGTTADGNIPKWKRVFKDGKNNHIDETEKKLVRNGHNPTPPKTARPLSSKSVKRNLVKHKTSRKETSAMPSEMLCRVISKGSTPYKEGVSGGVKSENNISSNSNGKVHSRPHTAHCDASRISSVLFSKKRTGTGNQKFNIGRAVKLLRRGSAPSSTNGPLSFENDSYLKEIETKEVQYDNLMKLINGYDHMTLQERNELENESCDTSTDVKQTGASGDQIEPDIITQSPKLSKKHLNRELRVKSAKRHWRRVKQLLDMPDTDINTTDEDGLTPLHRAAQWGKTNIIHDLTVAGSDINAQDKTNQWTPLHHSVANGRLEATDLLLFLGADMAVKDKDGDTIFQLPRTKALTSLIQQCKRGLYKNSLQHFQVNHSGGDFYFSDVGVRITIPPNAIARTINVSCRRLNPDEFTVINLARRETLLSDVIDFRPRGITFDKMITISVRTFEESLDDQLDVFVKMDDDFEICVASKLPENGSISFTSPRLDRLYVVCKPRIDTFYLDSYGGIFTTECQEVVLDIPPGAVNENGHFLTVKVSPVSDNTIIESQREICDTENHENNTICSLGPIVDIESTLKLFSKPITLSLNFPPKYTGKGSLFVVTSSGDETEVQAIEKACVVGKGVVSLNVDHFSWRLVIEATQNTNMAYLKGLC